MSKITIKNKLTVPDGTDAITSTSSINMQGNDLENVGEVQTSGLMLIDSSSGTSVEVSSMDGKSVHFLGQSKNDDGALKAGIPTLSDVADPVNPQDAATKNYVDTELEAKPSTAELNAAIQAVNPAGKYLPLSGGTMSGRINMNNNHIMGSYYLGLKNLNFILGNAGDDALLYQPDETTVSFINKNGLTKLAIGDPTELDHAATKKYVDDAVAAGGGGGGDYLPLTGGDMSGDINMDVHSLLDAHTVRIIRDDSIEVDYPSDTITFQLGETPDNLAVYGGNNDLATVSIATPQADKHAATKEYVDAIAAMAGDGKYLPLTGGKMTGSINMNGSQIADVIDIIFRHDTDKLYATDGISNTGDEFRIGMANSTTGKPVRIGTPTDNQHAATKKYVDDAVAAGGGGDYLPLSGGSMTGGINMVKHPITGISMLSFQTQSGYTSIAAISRGTSEFRIGMSSDISGVPTRVGTPTDDNHAATKAYVDTAIVSANVKAVSGSGSNYSIPRNHSLVCLITKNTSGRYESTILPVSADITNQQFELKNGNGVYSFNFATRNLSFTSISGTTLVQVYAI